MYSHVSYEGQIPGFSYTQCHLVAKKRKGEAEMLVWSFSGLVIKYG
jgi:hypothetical protein